MIYATNEYIEYSKVSGRIVYVENVMAKQRDRTNDSEKRRIFICYWCISVSGNEIVVHMWRIDEQTNERTNVIKWKKAKSKANRMKRTWKRREWDGMGINNQYCTYISGILPQTQFNWIEFLGSFFLSLWHMCNARLPLYLASRGQNTIAACLTCIVQWFTCMHIYWNWNTDFFQCILPIDNDIFVIINFLGYCCWCSIFVISFVDFARMMCTNKQ